MTSTAGSDVLFVTQSRKPERKPGWLKVAGVGMPGILNIQWEPQAQMLLVRAVAKQGNTPHRLLGPFLDYLLGRFGEGITSVNIQLRVGTRKRHTSPARAD